MSSQGIITGILWGMVLGIFYFGGLWCTVKRVPLVRRPKLLLLLSFLFRLAAVTAAFRLVLQQGAEPFAAAFLVFIACRFVMTGLLGRPLRGGMHAN